MKKFIPKNINKLLKKTKKILLQEINILLRPILLSLGFDLNPFFERDLIKEIKYIEKKMTYFYMPNLDQRFNSITVDTSYTKTALCDLGKKYPTDKSPYNDADINNHSYSGVYNLLFSNIRYNNLLIAEIGILFNNSIKCWREFFKNATIYGLEYDSHLLDKAKKDNLDNVYYKFIDVRDEKNIETCFEQITEKQNRKFDLIIDDSLHDFDFEGLASNIKKINTIYKFLKPGGILIVEDIDCVNFKKNEQEYFFHLNKLRKYYSEITFINCKHFNNYSPAWNLTKLLICIRNDVI